MMLDYLHEPEAAGRVRRAVCAFFENGEGFTPDLGGHGTTRDVADRIVELIQAGI